MISYGLIPARAGSKSITKKNLLPLKGTPLFLWSVKSSNDSKEICKTFVSSDDQEILHLSKENNFIGVKRPTKYAGDKSRDTEYISHFLDYLEKDGYVQPDLVVILRPTCPNRDFLIIDKGIKFFNESNQYDSLRSVILSSQTPFKMWYLDEKNELEPIISDSNIYQPFNAPRQLLPKVFWQDGYLEIIKVSSYLKGNYPGKIKGFINPSPAYDIDSLKDIPNDVLPKKEDLADHLPKDSQNYSS